VLYRPDAFEPVVEEPWKPAAVAAAIREIVAEAEGAYGGPRGLWAAHEWDGWHGVTPMKNLYVGAAGVVYALDALRRRGVAETRLDLAGLAGDVLALEREAPDYMWAVELPEPRAASVLAGEAGVVLVACLLGADEELGHALHGLVRENVANPVDELMWGVPGSLAAARAMLVATGEDRWREAWHECADALLARRDADGLWAHRLYGEKYRGLGPAHGLVGNVLALRALLDETRRFELERETAAVLARTAIVEDGLANWWYQADGPHEELSVQWCSGAPGILSSAGAYLDEWLLLAGAGLVWRAGAHGAEKGSSICHGTAGSGYALLAVFERTRDEQWLVRARRLAVHALAQVHAARAERGRGRYSLWTGDLGVALLAADCLEGRGAYPFLPV
jgi:hypothetical protein